MTGNEVIAAGRAALADNRPLAQLEEAALREAIERAPDVFERETLIGLGKALSAQSDQRFAEQRYALAEADRRQRVERAKQRLRDWQAAAPAIRAAYLVDDRVLLQFAKLIEQNTATVEPPASWRPDDYVAGIGLASLVETNS
jgi:hypothetical protein